MNNEPITIEYNGDRMEVPSLQFVTAVLDALFDFKKCGMVPQRLEVAPHIHKAFVGFKLDPEFDDYKVYKVSGVESFRWVGYMKPEDVDDVSVREDQS